jgi:hypothetical protein
MTEGDLINLYYEGRRMPKKVRERFAIPKPPTRRRMARILRELAEEQQQALPPGEERGVLEAPK